MRARIDLVKILDGLAKQIQSVDAWTLVANHYLEILRLNSSDNSGQHSCVPFILLRLNRDDDAYCFCRYWARRTFDDTEGEEEDERYATSTEGQWMYPRQENCRYLDIFEEVEPDAVDLTELLAFAVMKMRLVAVYDSRMNELEAFTSTEASKLLGSDELGVMRRNVIGTIEEEAKLADQRRQLDQILDCIQARNAVILPALLNPAPMLSQARPSYYSRGTASEARMIFEDILNPWSSIPGAVTYLANRFGTTTPTYPISM
jgi:hypothetical protein